MKLCNHSFSSLVLKIKHCYQIHTVYIIFFLLWYFGINWCIYPGFKSVWPFHEISRNHYNYSKNKDILLAGIGFMSMKGYITTIIDGSQREFWEYQL